MRGDLARYAAFSFGGGLDVKTSPLALSMRKVQDRLTKADNCVYTISRGVTKRFDYAVFNTVSIGASVAITGGIQFRHSNGTDFILAGTNDGRLVQFNTDGTTANIKTGLTNGTRWSMDVYNDKVISVNGADVPRKWDGTTDAVLGGTPPAKASMVVVHSNRVFMLDETLTSRLTWSGLNSEEDYVSATNAGSMLIDPNNSFRLTGMVSASKSELILAKPNKVYRLQGTQPSTYSVTNLLPALAGAGNLSFQAIVYALNDVFMLAADGIHQLRTVLEFGDLKVAYASERIDPYFSPHSDFTLASNSLNLAVACYDRDNSRIYFAVDSNGDGQNDLVLVYDVALACWSTWPGVKVASMWLARNSSTGENEPLFGGYDGFVRRLNVPVGSLDPIAAEVRHISNLNALGIEKSPRHLFVYLKEQGNYCVAPGTRVLTADLRWVSVETLRVGDDLLAFDEETRLGGRHYAPSHVVSTGLVRRPVWQITLADGTVLKSSSEHPWLVARKGNPRARWETTEDIAKAVGDSRWGGHRARVFPRFLPVWERKHTYESGYLAAAFDGEGCVGTLGRRQAGLRLTMAQKKNEMLSYTERLLTCEEISYVTRVRPSGLANIDLLGLLAEKLRFLGAYRPVRLLARFMDFTLSRRFHQRLDSMEWLDVVSAEYLGEQDVVAMGTSSRTYFAEGFGAHNTVTVDTKFDFGATGGQTYAVSLLGNAHTIGVNWVLGVDPLGAKKQIVKRVDVSGTGEYLEVGFKNIEPAQPFSLYGYEVYWRPRRLVRRGA